MATSTHDFHTLIEEARNFKVGKSVKLCLVRSDRAIIVTFDISHDSKVEVSRESFPLVLVNSEIRKVNSFLFCRYMISMRKDRILTHTIHCEPRL